MIDFTRRRMLGVAAGTVVGVVGPGSTIERAAADDTSDLSQFVKISAALTGIHEKKLAPDVDPVQVKHDYFNQAKSDPGFGALMQIARDTPDADSAAEKIMNNADPQIKYLGRSIILAWYLGVWYEPTVLAQVPAPFPVNPLKVVSPVAYTQGWVWRVAQAHPMGYSEQRFGYWSDEPLSLGDFITVPVKP